jgi:hypothetical protein
VLPMKVLIASMALFSLCQACSVSADNGLGTSFLREEPYRKTKQAVDMSSIRNEHDLRVVRDAINPVMRFVVGLSFAGLPPAVSALLVTEHGRSVLQQPPLRNERKRYSVQEIRDWRVCGTDAVSFTGVFTDLFRKNPWERAFLFVKTHDGWRFDDHRAARC